MVAALLAAVFRTVYGAGEGNEFEAGTGGGARLKTGARLLASDDFVAARPSEHGSYLRWLQTASQVKGAVAVDRVSDATRSDGWGLVATSDVASGGDLLSVPGSAVLRSVFPIFFFLCLLSRFFGGVSPLPIQRFLTAFTHAPRCRLSTSPVDAELAAVVNRMADPILQATAVFAAMAANGGQLAGAWAPLVNAMPPVGALFADEAVCNARGGRMGGWGG